MLSSQDTNLPPTFASKPILRLKSQQILQSEDKEWPMGRCTILQKYWSFLIYTSRNQGHVGEWILWFWDSGKRNINLDQVRFIDMGPINWHSSFKVAAWVVRKGSNSLFGSLKHGLIDGSLWVNQKCLPLLSLMLQRRFRGLREIETQERVCHLRPTNPHWEDPLDISFTILEK